MSTAEPKILRVETGYVASNANAVAPDTLDYHIYDHVPRWWRKIEVLLRLDFYLAMRARQRMHSYDLIWAGSEKVALPLTLLGVSRPLVVVAHYMESRYRTIPGRLLGIGRRWAAAGYVTDSSRAYLMSEFGFPADRLFQYFSARLDELQPGPPSTDGPIISAGVAKRDYRTLVGALAELPGYTTEIYASSRYGDRYQSKHSRSLPAWVQLKPPVTRGELAERYRRARFVVVPLLNTQHSGAGISVALEAAACGKAVIATRTAGMPTYVIDGQTGILVPPQDPEALRAAIKHLWALPELAAQMGRAGRLHAEQHFDHERVNQKIDALLELVAQAAAPSVQATGKLSELAPLDAPDSRIS